MTKRIQIIPENIAFPEAIVLDNSEKWMTELYEEADRKTAEKFGRDSLAYKTITNEINIKNITGSQFFWNTELGLYLPKNQKVISLKDMEEINNLDESFFSGFYTDSPQLVLRTNKCSYEKNKYILEHFVEQVKKQGFEFSSEKPLIISNLKLIKDENTENEYGLLLKIEKDTILENDSRFAYSNNGEKISFGEKQKNIYTIDNSLSRVYLYRSGFLNTRNGIFAYSNDYGRVVLKDAEGVVASENLRDYKSLLNKKINQKILDLKRLEKEINKI